MTDEWKPIKVSKRFLKNDQISIRRWNDNTHKVYFGSTLMKSIRKADALFCNVYKKNTCLLFQFTNKREVGISRQLHKHSITLPKDVFSSFNIPKGTSSFIVQTERNGTVIVDLEQFRE